MNEAARQRVAVYGTLAALLVLAGATLASARGADTAQHSAPAAQQPIGGADRAQRSRRDAERALIYWQRAQQFEHNPEAA